MKKAVVFLVLIIAALLLFGCTVSVNPLDLYPSKKYTTQTETSSTDTNTLGGNLGSTTQNTTKLSLTQVEIAKHARAGDCFMIINGNVYDLSEYVNHPGGDVYIPYCGKDGTNGYNTRGGKGSGHSSFADYLLSGYLVGKLGAEVTLTDTNKTILSAGSNSTNPQNNPRQNDDDEEYEDD